MHGDLVLFVTITMALITAFTGGYVARRLGLPTIVGYLLAGLVIGPFTPGFVGDSASINQLAEMGVIFMLFGVGLHFSIKDLWSVRRIAIPGAALQMLFTTLLGFALTQLWGWSLTAGLVLGLSISIASTVVLLRGLADNGFLNTPHGKVAIGWLILEDLATVAILVLLPAFAGTSDNPFESIALALVKTGLFVAIMLFIGVRLMPWILTQIAHTRSRELFILAVVALALGTALVAAELFGVSLALGAFLAGVVVSESDISHQVSAEILPFRDIFSVLFFVSVGMLVNPMLIATNLAEVAALTALIVVGKSVITLLLGLVLPGSGRTLIVVAAGLSQIGEFSFIVGQAGLALGILTQDQYGLILAGAVLSIIINPLMFRAVPAIERLLQRVPILWKRMERGGPTPNLLATGFDRHVVIVGYGRVGKHTVRVLQHLKLPFFVVEQDAVLATELQQQGIHTLFGDAANSEILAHTNLDRARALVVTTADQSTAELIVAAAHDLAPDVPIIARAETETGMQRLSRHGANHVIHPELEGGLEIMRYTLLTLGYSMGHIQKYMDAVREGAYTDTLTGDTQHRVLDQLVTAVRGIEIEWHPIAAGSSLLGQTLKQANLRANVGASIIAMIRDQAVMPNPNSDVTFLEGDVIGLIGSPNELAAAAQMLHAQNLP